MRVARFSVTVLAALVTAACTTDAVDLNYQLSASPIAAIPGVPADSITVGSFVDQRGNTPRWLGAIRGGFGQPLKTLKVEPSVAAVVRNAFVQGLRARDLLASGNSSTYQISGVIETFDCSQYVRREAHAKIQVDVFNSETGKQVFERVYAADGVNGSRLALSTGYFGSVGQLRALSQKVLTKVVNKALNDTALQAALRRT